MIVQTRLMIQQCNEFFLKKRNRIWNCILIFFIITGCGYTFQSSKSILREKEGISKIYIDPMVNGTTKGGVENLVYNNLLRVLISHRKIVIVSRPSEADAILSGVITGAYYSGSAGTSVASLNPLPLGAFLSAASYTIWTEYLANLSCSFSLNRTKSVPGKKKLVWSSSFIRSKPFPGSNQLDVPGTTSTLINESEFDRALSDLARGVMEDVHESMLAMF